MPSCLPVSPQVLLIMLHGTRRVLFGAGSSSTPHTRSIRCGEWAAHSLIQTQAPASQGGVWRGHRRHVPPPRRPGLTTCMYPMQPMRTGHVWTQALRSSDGVQGQGMLEVLDWSAQVADGSKYEWVSKCRRVVTLFVPGSRLATWPSQMS